MRILLFLLSITTSSFALSTPSATPEELGLGDKDPDLYDIMDGWREGKLEDKKDTGEFKYVNPGYGIGFRFKFNKRSRTAIALDLGWGKDDSQGIYMRLVDAF